MTQPPDILKTILQKKKEVVAKHQQRLPLSDLKQKLQNASPVRNFLQALTDKINKGQSAVIAEIKKASPSKGVIREQFDPVAIAKSYESAGAACLSILTDVEFFQGSDEYLQQVRSVCSLPILRKDFIIDPYQIYESRYLGADCILLIVAALSPDELKDFSVLAKNLNLSVLVEVHDAQELQIALDLKTPLLGINNRDLRTFKTDLNTTIHLLEKIPSDFLVVTESGIHTVEDVKLLRQHNVNAFLVGEAFMKSEDPGKELSRIFDKLDY